MNIFLISLVLISFANCDLKLAIFGDTGEIEPYRKHEAKSFKGEAPDDLTKVTATPDGNWACAFSDTTTKTTVTKAFATDHVMPNWQSVLGALKDKIAAADYLVVLGDMVYPESKFYGKSSITSGNEWAEPAGLATSTLREKYWQQRRHCGWIAFSKSFTFETTVSKKFIDTSGKLNAKCQVIPGNHLYDIAPKNELTQMGVYTLEDKTTTWWYQGKKAAVQSETPLWTNAVRATRVTSGNTKIVFIDFNSALFELVSDCKDACDAGKVYTKLGSDKTFWMGKTEITGEDVFDHIEGLFQALGKEKANGNVILRCHHAPFNLEGDWMGMLNYKSPGHGSQTLLEAMKDAKVSLYLSSHHHSSQLWAFPYDKVGGLQKATTLEAKRDKTKFTDCIDNSAKKCVASTFNFEQDLASPNYFFVVLVGNSGRFFDPIEPDSGSYGHLLWGRAGSSIPPVKGDAKPWKDWANSGKFYYGGAFMSFTDTKITTEFYEVQAGAAVLTNTFTLTTSGFKSPNKPAAISGCDGSKVPTSKRLARKQRRLNKLRKQRKLRKAKLRKQRRLRRKNKF